MTDEVRDYAERKIWESGVRMVPGHYPEFGSKEQVDDWLDIQAYMFMKAFGGDAMPEISSIDVQRYKDLLWKLKKNEDNVPLEILRTRHRVAYNSLRQELKEMTEAIIREVVYGNLYIKRSEAEESIQRINKAVTGAEIYKSINKAIYQEKCYGSVIAGIMKLRKLALEAAEDESGKEKRWHGNGLIKRRSAITAPTLPGSSTATV